MGYMRHHAIVVTSYDETQADIARQAALGIGMLVTGLVTDNVNGYVSFLVAPDGSKEGWGASDVGDVQRQEFIDWINGRRFEDGSSPFDWVVVQYGDGMKVTKVIAHSDEEMR